MNEPQKTCESFSVTGSFIGDEHSQEKFVLNHMVPFIIAIILTLLPFNTNISNGKMKKYCQNPTC
jgi:heme/copper-type cytochrome/quinol oxidase subunit 4